LVTDNPIAASLQSRREKLLRAALSQRIRTRVAFGLSGCVAFFALAAFLAGDPKAAALCALMASVTFGFTCIAAMAGWKKAVDSLREMDQST
jgi:hypothetical protein